MLSRSHKIKKNFPSKQRALTCVESGNVQNLHLNAPVAPSNFTWAYSDRENLDNSTVKKTILWSRL